MITIVADQQATPSVAAVCRALAVPRALPPTERERVLAVLYDARFADLPPAEVYATLLDEGKYIDSTRTMHPIFDGHDEVKKRGCIPPELSQRFGDDAAPLQRHPRHVYTE